MYGLKTSEIQDIKNIFAKYPNISEVILYGSRAKGNFKMGSDIDLTLKGDSISLSDLNLIALNLDDLFLPYTFDLSIFSQIENSDLIAHITRVGIVFILNRKDYLAAGASGATILPPPV